MKTFIMVFLSIITDTDGSLMIVPPSWIQTRMVAVSDCNRVKSSLTVMPSGKRIVILSWCENENGERYENQANPSDRNHHKMQPKVQILSAPTP